MYTARSSDLWPEEFLANQLLFKFGAAKLSLRSTNDDRARGYLTQEHSVTVSSYCSSAGKYVYQLAVSRRNVHSDANRIPPPSGCGEGRKKKALLELEPDLSVG